LSCIEDLSWGFNRTDFGVWFGGIIWWFGVDFRM